MVVIVLTCANNLFTFQLLVVKEFWMTDCYERIVIVGSCYPFLVSLDLYWNWMHLKCWYFSSTSKTWLPQCCNKNQWIDKLERLAELHTLRNKIASIEVLHALSCIECTKQTCDNFIFFEQSVEIYFINLQFLR